MSHATDKLPREAVSAPDRAASAPNPLTRLLRGEAALGYLFVAPAVLFLLVSAGYPLLLGIWYSLHDKVFGLPAEFVGLDNFIENLGDARFRRSVVTTVTYAAAAVVLKCVLGFAVALLLNREFPLRGVLRSLILLSWGLPEIAVVLGWSWLLDSQWGVINYLLTSIGLIESNIAWLSDPSLALATVVGVDVWRTFPFFAITILAALQGIDSQLYEATRLDGAGPVQQFRYITLPHTLPVLSVVIVLATIWNLNDFTTIWFLTQGGPGGATEIISIYTYQVAFAGLNDIGQAASVSVMAMPLLAVLIGILVYTTKKREKVGG